MAIIRDNKDADVDLTNGRWIKIKDIALMIGNKLGKQVILGDKNGYNNKINSNPYQNLRFNVSLNEGITYLIEKAKKIYVK
ncbi:MAG: hypothetical protein R2753_17785 [Chitinophagales bacterium]